MIENEIKALLKTQIPAIEESFKSQVKHQFNAISKHYQVGVPGGFRGITGSYTYAHIWSSIRAFVKFEYGVDASKTVVAGLDEEKLVKAAKAYAESAANEWFSKIMEKVGELEGAMAHHLSGAEFKIIGKKDGRHVEIHQQMIVNMSPKGKLFNQFPARIYLEGKPISAASYKKVFN